MAQLVPSNCNAQPWRVEILSGAAIDRLREVLFTEIAGGIDVPPDYPITTVILHGLSWTVYATRSAFCSAWTGVR